MKNKNREKLILKIEKVVKLGWLPSRQYQSYKVKFQGTKKEVAESVNCFEHAFFNFTNEELRNLFVSDKGLEEKLLSEFWNFNLKKTNTQEQNLEPLLDIVRRTGLEVSPCSEYDEIKDNEWKVAVYYDDGEMFNDLDFHFLRQEKDGIWTSKNADESRVEQYIELPYYFRKSYTLFGVYKVTNKYAQIDEEKDVIEEKVKTR